MVDAVAVAVAIVVITAVGAFLCQRWLLWFAAFLDVVGCSLRLFAVPIAAAYIWLMFVTGTVTTCINSRLTVIVPLSPLPARVFLSAIVVGGWAIAVFFFSCPWSAVVLVVCCSGGSLRTIVVVVSPSLLLTCINGRFVSTSVHNGCHLWCCLLSPVDAITRMIDRCRYCCVAAVTDNCCHSLSMLPDCLSSQMFASYSSSLGCW